MASWLYPISNRGDFSLHGETLPGGYENFKKIVKDHRLGEDPAWRLSTNFRRVQVKDDVFLYTGEQDLGIIGYASVKEINSSGHSLELDFDYGKCEQLLDNPVPAALVRKWVYPRRPVVELKECLAKLNSLLPWKGGQIRKEAEVSTSRVAGAGFGRDSDRNKKVELAAIKEVTSYYKKQGWIVDPTYQIKRMGFDLLCSKGPEVKKVEVKGVSGSEVSFIITAGERKASKDEAFVLHVVCSALSKPILKTWSGREMEEAFKFTEIQYLAQIKKD